MKRKTKRALWVKLYPKQRSKSNRTGRGGKFTRRVSKKRAMENRIYSKKRKEFLSLAPWCERCCQKGRWIHSTCVHHRSGRRSNYLKTETWRASCDSCNQFAKDHPSEARAEGWIAPVGVYLT